MDNKNSNVHGLNLRAIRRMQLSQNPELLDPIVGTPIATAYAIVTHPHPAVRCSSKVNGTAHRILLTALNSVAGFKKAPTAKMRWLLSQLKANSPLDPQPLPPPSPVDEMLDHVREAIAAIGSNQFTTQQSRTLATRCLDLLNKIDPDPFPNSEIAKLKNTLTYLPQLHPPGTTSLLHTPPQGNA